MNQINAQRIDSNTSSSQGYYWASGGILCFALTLPVTKMILTDFDPMFIALARSAISGILSALLLWLMKARLPTVQQSLSLIAMALGVIFGFPILSALAMASTSATHGGIISALLPLSTAIAATFISKEKLSKIFWLCAVGASILVMVFSLLMVKSAINIGDLWLVLSIPLGALGYAIGGDLAKSLPAWQVICWALVLSLPLTVPLSFIYLPENLSTVTVTSWSGLLYLALFSQWLGFFFWNKGLAMGGIAKVSQLQLFQPFATLLAASFIVGEVIQLSHFITCAGVALFVYLGKRG